jgi:hypothetical protein
MTVVNAENTLMYNTGFVCRQTGAQNTAHSQRGDVAIQKTASGIGDRVEKDVRPAK